MSTPGEKEGTELRSATSTYVGAAYVGLFWIVVCAYYALTKTGWAWVGVALSAILCGSVLWNYAYLRVQVADGAFTYRSLLTTRRLPLDEIAEGQLHRGFRTGPFLVLVSPSHERPVRINLAPFRTEEIRTLVSIPELKCEHREHVA